MAFSSFVRRASSSLIPLSIRSIGYRRPYQRQISPLNFEYRFAAVGVQFLPFVRFSTVTNNNIVSLIESKDVIRISDIPFSIEDNNGSLLFVKRIGYDTIKLDVCGDTYQVTDGNPKFPMTVRITNGGLVKEFQATVEPNTISIHSLKMRHRRSLFHLPNFQEYLRNKGIHARTIDNLLNYLRKQQDGLDALPFDIKAGGLEEGHLSLVNKSPHEIIEVKVRPYYVKEVPLKRGSSATRVLAETMRSSKLLRDGKDEDIHHLYMLVKIYYGDQFSKCQKFFIFAYPGGMMQIRMMTMSGAEPSTKLHFEEFEKYFKKQGIMETNLKWLFDYFKDRRSPGSPAKVPWA